MSVLKSILKGRWGYFFIAPAYILFTVFTLYPLVDGILLGFYDAGLANRTWVGLENYSRLFTDSMFIQSLTNTVRFVLLIVPTTLVLALLFAVLIYSLNRVLQAFYRAAFYLPSVASGVVLVTVWLWIYNPTYGLLNYLTSLVGLPRIAWLGDPRYALPALAVVVVSWILGRPIILFIAGLNGISRDVYEAAMIDGASPWQQFVRISLPLLRPTSVFVLITQTIGVFQTFVVVQLLTKGGPAYTTHTIVYSIYETAFQFFEFGYASAMGGILLVISGSIAIIQFKMLNADIEY